MRHSSLIPLFLLEITFLTTRPSLADQFLYLASNKDKTIDAYEIENSVTVQSRRSAP